MTPELGQSTSSAVEVVTVKYVCIFYEVQWSILLFMSTPFKGGSTYCFTAVSVGVRSELASALALASGLTQRHPLLDFFLGAPKYDPSYVENIFHW